jgi:NtrC-family two-component system response regulator AlgB
LEILDNLLTTSGYVVTSVSNLKDAQAICESEVFDVALIDVQLGEDLGTVLAQQLIKDSPTTKVILMTGFSRHVEKYQDLAGVQLLRKPFPMYDLLETIQKSLNRTS